MADQPAEHFVDPLDLTIEPGPTLLDEIPKPLGKLYLRVQLTREPCAMWR